MKYRLFCVGVTITLIVAFSFSGSFVSGSSRFKIWNVQQNLKLGHGYVKSSLGDETVVAIVLANVRLANGNYQVEPTLANVFRLLKESRALISVPMVAVRSGTAEMRAVNYDAHLRHTMLTTQDSIIAIENLKAKAEELLAGSNACLASKRSGDQEFYDGVQTLHADLSQEGLALSLEQAPCYITKRIQAHAYTYLAAYLQPLTSILLQRQTILTNHRDTFLRYPELFETDTLEKLLVLKQQMLGIRPLNEQQMRSAFTIFMFTDTTQIPVFDKVFFSPQDIPTFQDSTIVLRTSSQDIAR